MSELSNFQKNFLAGSGHVEVFTQKEFDDALTLARAEIMTVAIDTTKAAIYIEREACADMVKEAGHAELAEKILNRIPAQRQ
jgi:hypothetical protein